MKNQLRNQLLSKQLRAYTEGIFENINDQWVFFDEETDEAYPLEEYMNNEISIYRNNRWRKGTLVEDGKLLSGKELIFIKDEDQVRIKKNLQYSLERLLEELRDDAFFQFITTLNSMDFSAYDCIYGYNQLSFSSTAQSSGTNFFIFDNGDYICSVHHHFNEHNKEQNRFEFTLNTGKRMIIEKLVKNKD
ncbi:DUF2777 family protein [Pradoshia sp. D12]|uniref:DUF2777 family protein n=1 Tax=Bacillaceae TaxID=186817 RepID=UPI00080AEFFD|nr:MULTISPECIES: DUF2777 family protein [Bacillaceae]OCA90024.1 hypothetical protein A8L44_03605 [Bacillus sp. FJAT-27986]QFK70568.1 DUF2777 family protein [Pradoshia sp. D12]TPF72364.1 DUF2777 family protein [Bacillus sp. D12]